MHRSFPSFAAALIAAIGLSPLATQAALLDSEEPAATAKSPQPTLPEAPGHQATPSATGGTVTGNATEILLQLTDKPAIAQDRGVDPTSRHATLSSPQSSRPAPQPEMGSVLSTLADLKRAFVGGSPDEASSRGATATDAPETRTGMTNAGTPDPVGSRAQREPGSGLMNHPGVRFIRENRGWLALGGAAIAVALWLTATMSSGRRR